MAHEQSVAPTPVDGLPLVKGLPPAQPPSVRVVAQLFFVPGLIVAAVVLFIVGLRYLFGGIHTAEYFLQQLDSSNADIRWRGASDLAQILKRPESVALRTDVKFALDLAQRLRAGLDELVLEERMVEQQALNLKDEQKAAAWRSIAPRRDFVQFLAATLGEFHCAVGVPLLSEIALRDESPDVKGNILRRRQAIWILGNLGESLKGFAKLPAETQAAVRDRLANEAAAPGPRAHWARNGLYYLENKRAQGWDRHRGMVLALPALTQGVLPALAMMPLHPDLPPGVVAVDLVLARCARAEDRDLRARVAGVLSFWPGDLIEPTLLLLARDPGHGTLIRIAESD